MKISSLILSVILFTFIISNPLDAQWVRVSQPNDGSGGVNVNCFLTAGSNLFAGTSGGVFLSTDKGINWTAVNTNLTYPDVETLTIIGDNLFAGAIGGGGAGGIFLSTNNGTNWINTGLTDNIGLGEKWVMTLFVNNNTLIAATRDGVFLLPIMAVTGSPAISVGLAMLLP